MENFTKPENALKRADELISVGEKQDALQALHTSERYRAWQKPLEKIMLKYLDLCAYLKREPSAEGRDRWGSGPRGSDRPSGGGESLAMNAGPHLEAPGLGQHMVD